MGRGYRDEDESEDVFKCQAICKKERDKALLVVIDGDEKWVPKSVIHDDSEVFDADENARGTLVLKRWWAEENELVED